MLVLFAITPTQMEHKQKRSRSMRSLVLAAVFVSCFSFHFHSRYIFLHLSFPHVVWFFLYTSFLVAVLVSFPTLPSSPFILSSFFTSPLNFSFPLAFRLVSFSHFPFVSSNLPCSLSCYFFLSSPHPLSFPSLHLVSFPSLPFITLFLSSFTLFLFQLLLSLISPALVFLWPASSLLYISLFLCISFPSSLSSPLLSSFPLLPIFSLLPLIFSHLVLHSLLYAPVFLTFISYRLLILSLCVCACLWHKEGHVHVCICVCVMELMEDVVSCTVGFHSLLGKTSMLCSMCVCVHAFMCSSPWLRCPDVVMKYQCVFSLFCL